MCPVIVMMEVKSIICQLKILAGFFLCILVQTDVGYYW